MNILSDRFSEIKKASEPLYRTPKSVQETVEILKISEGGIFEVAEGRYSKTYRFSDVNYATRTENEQESFFQKYCKCLNSFDCTFKITVNNRNRDKEGRDVALGLEIFVTGALNIFNHQTNINVNNRFIVYGIRDLGESLAPLAMLVMMETIQQKIIQNGENGKATWFYIDEVHVLLNSQFSAEYLRQMWKKVRKQGGLCTGITQNIVDLLMSETSTTMLSNSAFILLLNQSSKDIEKIVEALEISEEQLNYVIDSPSGCGLIKCGSRMVPFDNVIDKDSELYRLYNTNLYEKMEKGKEISRVD